VNRRTNLITLILFFLLIYKMIYLHCFSILLLVLSTLGDVRVAFTGDNGVRLAQEVYNRINLFNSELIIHSGDLGYQRGPYEFFRMSDSIVGPEILFVPAIGSHDIDDWDIYSSEFISRINNNSNITCTGELGIKSSCIYKNLIQIISIAPRFERHGFGSSEIYRRYAEISLRNSNIPWKICLFHASSGNFQTSVINSGRYYNVYQTCRTAGAFIVSGNAHIYTRTHGLSNFNPIVIGSISQELTVGLGNSFSMVVGIGGQRIFRKDPVKESWAWIARSYGFQDNIGSGVVLCNFNTNRANCTLVSGTGNILDIFSIVDSSDVLMSKNLSNCLQRTVVVNRTGTGDTAKTRATINRTGTGARPKTRAGVNRTGTGDTAKTRAATPIPSNNTQIPSNNTQIPSNNTQIPSNNTQIPSNDTSKN